MYTIAATHFKIITVHDSIDLNWTAVQTLAHGVLSRGRSHTIRVSLINRPRLHFSLQEFLLFYVRTMAGAQKAEGLWFGVTGCNAGGKTTICEYLVSNRNYKMASCSAIKQRPWKFGQGCNDHRKTGRQAALGRYPTRSLAISRWMHSTRPPQYASSPGRRVW